MTRPVGPVAAAASRLSVPGTAAQVEDRLAGLDVGEVEEVADAGERVDGLRGDGVQDGGRVAEPFGERAAGFEMEVLARIEGDLLIHRLDPDSRSLVSRWRVGVLVIAASVVIGGTIQAIY